MNSKLLMIASSAFLAVMGIAALFAPEEILVRLGTPTTQPLPVLVSLLGALYLAFAMTNWTAKTKLIGGIYGRPLSLGNFLHFMIGALTLFKYESARGFGGPLVIVLAFYGVFAVLFGHVVFSPARVEPNAG